MRSRKSRETVYRVSGVRESRTDDVRGRQRRYAISMGVRTLCFVGCVLTHGLLRIVLFVAALLLPYVAVVIANAGRARDPEAPVAVVLPSRTQLPPLRPDHTAPGDSRSA
jgi:Protein of unknown function (DUF3099)